MPCSPKLSRAFPAAAIGDLELTDREASKICKHALSAIPHEVPTHGRGLRRSRTPGATTSARNKPTFRPRRPPAAGGPGRSQDRRSSATTLSTHPSSPRAWPRPSHTKTRPPTKHPAEPEVDSTTPGRNQTSLDHQSPGANDGHRPRWRRSPRSQRRRETRRPTQAGLPSRSHTPANGREHRHSANPSTRRQKMRGDVTHFTRSTQQLIEPSNAIGRLDLAQGRRTETRPAECPKNQRNTNECSITSGNNKEMAEQGAAADVQRLRILEAKVVRHRNRSQVGVDLEITPLHAAEL